MPRVDLDEATVYGFTETLLKSRFDEPQPTPILHRQLWDACCSEDTKVAIAAPRNHAKSTAVTHSFGLSLLCFRVRDFGVIVSDTEGQAILFLGDIKNEFDENEELQEVFGKVRWIKESETWLIGEFPDGWKFCLMVRGSGQKTRGLKWRNKRPNFILCDDLENEELVANKETRQKFKRWFDGALVPCLAKKTGIIRVVGTIMHEDSLLSDLINIDDTWRSLLFEAHDDNFENILWPEQFSREDLMEIRRSFANKGQLDLYNQEYRNRPIDNSTAYFRKEGFKPISDYDGPLRYYVGVDFAISKEARRDFTAFVVAGIDHNGMMKVVDVYRDRWDTLEIIDKIFEIHTKYEGLGGIESWTVEKGQLEKAIGPVLNLEMMRRQKFMDFDARPADMDKERRGKSIQARHQAGAIEYDMEAEWWADFYSEIRMVPKSKYDDQFDAFAWLGITCHLQDEAPTYEEQLDEEWERTHELEELGANETTGY